MKKKIILSLVVLGFVIVFLCCLGVGYYSSSSAVRDLKIELENIYGMEYSGKTVENGTEDMIFVVLPKTWFLTNWNIRKVLCMDYEYECKVIFTNYIDGSVKSIRTITYHATDPMGEENMEKRAFLDLDSKVEKTENK
ncbi:MAG: hypothetical protein IKU69_04125 [Roseburia sp.]|nr:hypothetical protein [Roseburia sp.]